MHTETKYSIKDHGKKCGTPDTLPEAEKGETHGPAGANGVGKIMMT